MQSEHEDSSHNSQPQENQSMLSPRGFIKFISKNIQGIASPRISSIFTPSNSAPSNYSAMSPAQVSQEFHQYLNNIDKLLTKHKEISDKNQLIQIMNQPNSNADAREKDLHTKIKRQIVKEETEAEVILSRIPVPYFHDWDAEEAPLLGQEKAGESGEEKKSKKLGGLLGEEQAKQGKKGRRGVVVLRQKQEELEEHLDSIQYLIFGKTRKYPEKYLSYLMNFKDAKQEVDRVLSQLHHTRSLFNSKILKAHQAHRKVLTLLKKKQKMERTLKIMETMALLNQFKNNKSQVAIGLGSSDKEIPMPHDSALNSENSNTKLFGKILEIKTRKHLLDLDKLMSINRILINIDSIQSSRKEKRLRQFCTESQKFLSSTLSGLYSREEWLKSELPKDALMMAQIGLPSQEGEELNNSYLNISILDQSYCVTPSSSLSQKVSKSNRMDRQRKQLIKIWKDYLCEHGNNQMEEEEEQICQIVQRSLLKFNLCFHKDLEDYVSYIYAQNSLPLHTPLYTTHKERLRYIHPKFYNKILKLYFTGLSAVLTFTLHLDTLRKTKSTIVASVKEKIQQAMGMRTIDEQCEYEDVSVLVSVLDFWVEELGHVSDRSAWGDEDGEAIIMEVEEFIQKCRNKAVEDYLGCLHQHALVKELKGAIQKSVFTAISIPLSCFSILDYILNWGQERGAQESGIEEVDESFTMLSELEREGPERKQNFSIFKIIDKILIIQGIQFKICESFIPLAHYLAAYLHSKTQNGDLSPKIDEKICELIGFYVWFNKKVLFGVSKIGGQKKSIHNLCMMTNMCNLLLKIMDILAITNVRSKVDKVLHDIVTIKGEVDSEIGMVPFYLVEQQISTLYESRLKTRKQTPTKETLRILEIVDASRQALQEYYPDYQLQSPEVKRYLGNCMKMISKNYFGYLFNMEQRGKAELKWFVPALKQTVGDLFGVEIQNMERQLR